MSFPCCSSHLTLTYDSEDVFLFLHLVGSESHVFSCFSCRDPDGFVCGGLHAGALGFETYFLQEAGCEFA